METYLLTREEEFAGMEQEWNDLLNRSTANNPFLTHQWLYSWWRAFGKGAQLYILLCWENIHGVKTLVAIFPGYLIKSAVFPIRRLRLLGSEVVTSDFLDVIVAMNREEEVVALLWEDFARRKNFYYAELTDLRDDSPLLHLPTAGGISGLQPDKWQKRKLCPYIKLPEKLEEYFSGLSRNVRKNFQYYRRKLENQGALVEIVLKEEDLEQGLKDFIRLHQSRRQQKGDLGIFSSKEQELFYSEVFRRFFHAGWLELAFLNVASKRVAVVCQFNYGAAIYYYQTGYDVVWEKSSVGFVLNGLLIERAIMQCKASFEFLRGEEEYKNRLGVNGQRQLRDLYLTNGSLCGRVALDMKRLNLVVRNFLKRTVVTAGNFLPASRNGKP